MLGRLNGGRRRANGHAVPEPAQAVPPILTISAPPGSREGRALADAVAACFEVRLLDFDSGSEQLAGPIKETLTYLFDSPELLSSLLGSLSGTGPATDGRSVHDVLFDLAARSGVVVIGTRAGAMLSHRPDAFHVRVDPGCIARRAGHNEHAYHLLLDLELLPMETCIDLVLSASRSHARRLARTQPPVQPTPRRTRHTGLATSPDVVLERLARALKSEIGRNGS